MGMRAMVLELLSFVALYSPPKGTNIVLEAFNTYKKKKKESSRFAPLMAAFREEVTLEFLVPAVAFINSLTCAPDELSTRNALRKEFIDMGLLDVFDSLREDEANWAAQSTELNTQIEVFLEEMRLDDEETQRQRAFLDRMDRNDPTQIFAVLKSHAKGSPYYSSFISVLQMMLELTTATSLGLPVWTKLEKMYKQFYLTMDRSDFTEEVEVILKAELDDLRKAARAGGKGGVGAGTGGKGAANQKGGKAAAMDRVREQISKNLLSGTFVSGAQVMGTGSFGGAQTSRPQLQRPASVGSLQAMMKSVIKMEDLQIPPLTLVTETTAKPALSSPKKKKSQTVKKAKKDGDDSSSSSSEEDDDKKANKKKEKEKEKEKEQEPTTGDDDQNKIIPVPLPPISTPPPPPMMMAPPPPGMGGLIPPPPGMGGSNLPHKKIFHPKVKLKHLNWTKLPAVKIKDSFWAGVNDEKVELDFDEIERTFCAGAVYQMEKTEGEGGNSSKEGEGENGKKKKKTAITLINMKRANNCAIMLSGMKKSNEQLKKAIVDMDEKVLTAEMATTLIEYVPTKEEIAIIEEYQGDRSNLGKAEQFFWVLRDIPRLEQRLRALAFKLKFQELYDDVQPDIEAVVKSTKELKTSPKFKSLMEVILALGNYINGGTFRGAAYGFQLDVLTKLQDTRSHDGKFTLLNYLAELVERKHSELLTFAKELKHIPSACRVSFPITTVAMKELMDGLKLVEEELQQAALTNSATDKPLQATLGPFLQRSLPTCKKLDEEREAMEKEFKELAAYFGEADTCTPEQLFGTVNTFISAFETAHLENVKRREDAKKEANKPKDATLRANRRSRGGSVEAGPDGAVMEDMIRQIKSGAYFRKRREQGGDKGEKGGEKGGNSNSPPWMLTPTGKQSTVMQKFNLASEIKDSGEGSNFRAMLKPVSRRPPPKEDAANTKEGEAGGAASSSDAKFPNPRFSSSGLRRTTIGGETSTASGIIFPTLRKVSDPSRAAPNGNGNGNSGPGGNGGAQWPTLRRTGGSGPGPGPGAPRANSEDSPTTTNPFGTLRRVGPPARDRLASPGVAGGAEIGSGGTLNPALMWGARQRTTIGPGSFERRDSLPSSSSGGSLSSGQNLPPWARDMKSGARVGTLLQRVASNKDMSNGGAGAAGSNIDEERLKKKAEEALARMQAKHQQGAAGAGAGAGAGGAAGSSSPPAFRYLHNRSSGNFSNPNNNNNNSIARNSGNFTRPPSSFNGPSSSSSSPNNNARTWGPTSGKFVAQQAAAANNTINNSNNNINTLNNGNNIRSSFINNKTPSSISSSSLNNSVNVGTRQRSHTATDASNLRGGTVMHRKKGAKAEEGDDDDDDDDDDDEGYDLYAEDDDDDDDDDEDDDDDDEEDDDSRRAKSEKMAKKGGKGVTNKLKSPRKILKTPSFRRGGKNKANRVKKDEERKDKRAEKKAKREMEKKEKAEKKAKKEQERKEKKELEKKEKEEKKGMKEKEKEEREKEKRDREQQKKQEKRKSRSFAPPEPRIP
ncbi:putative WD repeat-containing protein 65 [Balamuthia mandrillaris]